MSAEDLLSEKYRFDKFDTPYQLTSLQKKARELFLNEVHKKNKYISITKCPYCTSDKFIKISEIDRRGLPADIAICNSCGGCFKSKVLDAEANKFHYERISYALRGKDDSSDAIEKIFLERVRYFAYPRYHFISHFLELRPGEDFIVEFGCNDGANLVPWHKKGFAVLGVELDPKMIEFGNKKGLNLIYGDLLKLNRFDRKPKLIILSHMLEHVTDVNLALSKLSMFLQPDGVLFIEVPGIRNQGLSETLRYFDVEHNYNFDLKSLARVLEKHSFKIIYADEYMRILCTPNQNQFIVNHSFIPFSLNKIKAQFIKALVNFSNFNTKGIHDLLKEKNKLKVKIISKLQRLYFKYYYLSIETAIQKKEK